MQDNREQEELVSDAENVLVRPEPTDSAEKQAPTATENINADGITEKGFDTDTQFIIPDEPAFFTTDEQEVEFSFSEQEPEPQKSELLDVEHFSDYKSETSFIDEFTTVLKEDEEDEETLEVTSDEFEENITLLDNEEETVEQITEEPKQKYENPDRERYNPEKPRRVDARFDFLELFIFTLLAVILLTSFIFRHSVVDGNSMQNTLQNGEHLIISDLFYSPKKGDIVVCQDLATGHSKPVVKRIIATEGDTIEILPDTGDGAKVFVNGKLLFEDYVFCDGKDTFKGLPKTTVPENMIFVMGDHRNASTDSREFDSTFVREDAILGKVILRFYPFNEFGRVD